MKEIFDIGLKEYFMIMIDILHKDFLSKQF